MTMSKQPDFTSKQPCFWCEQAVAVDWLGLCGKCKYIIEAATEAKRRHGEAVAKGKAKLNAARYKRVWARIGGVDKFYSDRNPVE